MNTIIRGIVVLGLMLVSVVSRGEDHIYLGHYASGLSKYTVKGGHLYQGHYASGLSAWTVADSTGGLHIYWGHYASGISKFTYKNGHLYQGHYASGLSSWTAADSSGGLHIYKGHYASGISKFTFKGGHVYRGHYASGISAWTFSDTTEVPEGLLVFLITQILEPEEEGAPADPTTPVIDPVSPTTPPSPEQPSDPEDSSEVNPPSDVVPSISAVWNKARTLRGVLEESGNVTAVVEVKCGRVDRRGQAKIAVSITPLSGKRRMFTAQKVVVQVGTTSVYWQRGTLSLKVGDEEFSGILTPNSLMKSASVGGDLLPGIHRLSVMPLEVLGELAGYELDRSRLPNDIFSANGRKWMFDRTAPAKVRLSYTANKGIFKGSFRAFYVATASAPRKRDRAVSVKIMGLVVDGRGVGLAASRRPQQDYSVTVE